MQNIRHIRSTEGACWQEAGLSGGDGGSGLHLTGERRQTILGFGGCFNELGWAALQAANPGERQRFLDELFSPEECNFNFGRVPVGANDFSIQWYSCDETPEDYELRDFSIARDRQFTIPFLREAMARQRDFWVFASPWSPPTWMKTKPVYNYGRMRMEPQVLDAYARYLVRFAREYAAEGIRVAQIHPQNEPIADQKFPSCYWEADDLLVFLRDYLGPALGASGLDTELWLGTLNGPFANTQILGDSAPFREFYEPYVNRILSDDRARATLTGLGVQWGGKNLLEQVDVSYPELRVMQTESECGDGRNSWEHMEYIFCQMWQYFRHRAERYAYWNIALAEGGESSWGWRQNSLATVNPATGALVRQPEFYLMKHFSAFVQPGAVYLGVGGHCAGTALAFQNPDGSVALVLGNFQSVARPAAFAHGGVRFTVEMEPHSLHTVVLPAGMVTR